MARIRQRYGKVCKLDWNPKHWETFVDMLINKLPFKLLRINNRPNLIPDTIKHKIKYIN